jgi:pimeloyl-ACP methyl ester carboxylesterase
MELIMPFADIRGMQIYYEIHGHGDPVMLIHHGFGCSAMWEEIIPQLVQNGYKTISYDRRGFGKSAQGPGFEEFYVSDRYRHESVNELETLRDWLGLPTFHVVGQCEGGVVGIDYAIKYPHRVSNLVTSSTLCYSTVPMTEFNASKFLKRFDELDPDLREKLATWHGERAEPFFNQFRQFGGAYGESIFDLRPVLPSVPCPTLVLYPDRSYLFEVEQGVAFYRHLPKGELAVLPKCGHNTYDDWPEEYGTHIVKFLTRHRFGEFVGDVKDAQQVTCAG